MFFTNKKEPMTLKTRQLSSLVPKNRIFTDSQGVYHIWEPLQLLQMGTPFRSPVKDSKAILYGVSEMKKSKETIQKRVLVMLLDPFQKE